MSIELLDAFRQKFRESVPFTEVDAKGFLEIHSEDQTWTIVRPGITRSRSSNATLFQLVADFVDYHRPADEWISEAKIAKAAADLLSLVPVGAKLRLSLQMVEQPDPDHMHVKVCLEAADPN